VSKTDVSSCSMLKSRRVMLSRQVRIFSEEKVHKEGTT